MREMSLATLVLSFVVVHQISGSASSDTHKATISNADEGLNYTHQSTKFTDGCKDLRGEGTPFDWETYEKNFATPLWRISHDNSWKNNIYLSVTIFNNWFHELIIRIQDQTVPKGENPHCQIKEFSKNNPPDQIKVSFRAWSGKRVTIQFVGCGKNGTFFREYSLQVHKQSGEIFAYVDTTYASKVRLYVEPLPERVDYCIGELREQINAKTHEFEAVDTFNLTREQLVHDARVHTNGAAYDFRLTPVVNGTNCSSTLTAGFVMFTAKSPAELFVLVVLSIVALVTSFCILHRLYICCRNRAWRNVKVHLLMIYDSTHPSHIKVVEQFALFLKNCNIHVMIDMWGIDKRQDRNPNLWCDESFAKADIVVVVSSPPESCYTGSDRPIHAFTQKHAIRLIVENYPRKDTEDKYGKKYVAVRLPYCKKADLPPDARKFQHFRIPEQTKELLNYCHKTDYTNTFSKWKNDQELIESIETAKSHILKGQPVSEQKDHTELNEVIFSGAVPVDDSESDEYDDEGFVLEKVSTDNGMKQEFINKERNKKYGTALEDLNLTGNKSESESEEENVTVECKSSPDCHMLMA